MQITINSWEKVWREEMHRTAIYQCPDCRADILADEYAITWYHYCPRCGKKRIKDAGND